MKKLIFKIIFFIISFSITLDVFAETGIVTDSDGVNMRDAATTNSNIIVAIPKNKEFYISNLNAGTGNGCNNNWYYVYYSNS